MSASSRRSTASEEMGFEVSEGQVAWLRGCSGSGKTSIARVISGAADSLPFDATVCSLDFLVIG